MQEAWALNVQVYLPVQSCTRLYALVAYREGDYTWKTAPPTPCDCCPQTSKMFLKRKKKQNHETLIFSSLT